MKYFIITVLLIASFNIVAKTPLSIKIVSLEDRAKLCPKPACGQDKEISRIKTNSILSVRASKTIKHGMMKSRWYKVIYNGKTGWVSEFNVKAIK